MADGLFRATPSRVDVLEPKDFYRRPAPVFFCCEAILGAAADLNAIAPNSQSRDSIFSPYTRKDTIPRRWLGAVYVGGPLLRPLYLDLAAIFIASARAPAVTLLV